jgi:hypothetical protein
MSIEIEQAIATDDSCQVKYWAKGHYHEGEFADAIDSFRIAEMDKKPCYIDEQKIKHIYYRKVPLKNNHVCDFQYIESEKGQGAFAVTVLEEWYPLF